LKIIAETMAYAPKGRREMGGTIFPDNQGKAVKVKNQSLRDWAAAKGKGNLAPLL